jgi:D-alanyl-D-alanine carboxypeptidase
MRELGSVGVRLVLLLSSVGCSTAPPDALTGGLDADDPAMVDFVDSAKLPEVLGDAVERMREHLGVPGMGVVVVTHDGIIETAVSGERAVGSGVLLKRDDPWHLGSNSKAMAALLAARLARQDRLSWDSTVADLLGDRVERMADGWEGVTYQQLLTHCSGLPANAPTVTVLGLLGEDRDGAADRLRYAANVLQKPPRTAPGTVATYSNAGYVVAGAMIEAQTGRMWRELVAEQVFEPLGLTSAGFGPPGSVDSLDTPRGHSPRWFGLGGLRAVAPDFGGDNPVALDPAGRIHMNLADYGMFLRDQLRGASGRGGLLPLEGYRRLQAPGCDPGMGYGWGITAEGDLRHAGSNGMWYAETIIWHDRKAAMAFVSNDGRVDRQRKAVLAFMDDVRQSLLRLQLE